MGRVILQPIKVEGLKTCAEFDVIEIVNDTIPYPSLLGIGWEMENLTAINFKKMIMTFENHDTRVISPLDPIKEK